MYALASEVHVCLNSTAVNKARVAQLEEYQTWSLGVLGSSPTVDKTFVFCRFLRAPSRSTGPIQMISNMTFIRGI